MGREPATWPYWVRLIGSQRHLSALVVVAALYIMEGAARAGREAIVGQMVMLITAALGILGARRAVETTSQDRNPPPAPPHQAPPRPGA